VRPGGDDDGTVVVDTNDVAASAHRRPAGPRTTGPDLTRGVPLDDDLESVFRYLVGP
jgi:hypothetical protein